VTILDGAATVLDVNHRANLAVSPSLWQGQLRGMKNGSGEQA